MNAICENEHLEALPVSASDPIWQIEEWVTRLSLDATAELMRSGHVVITTSRGPVEAWLHPPRPWRKEFLRIACTWDDGSQEVTRETVLQPGGDLPDEVLTAIEGAIVGMVELTWPRSRPCAAAMIHWFIGAVRSVADAVPHAGPSGLRLGARGSPQTTAAA